MCELSLPCITHRCSGLCIIFRNARNIFRLLLSNISLCVTAVFGNIFSFVRLVEFTDSTYRTRAIRFSYFTCVQMFHRLRRDCRYLDELREKICARLLRTSDCKYPRGYYDCVNAVTVMHIYVILRRRNDLCDIRRRFFRGLGRD